MRIRVPSRWLPLWAVVVLLLAFPPARNSTRAAAGDQGKPAAQANSGYQPPSLAIPDTMRPFLEQLQPGKDAFPLEGQATELDARLGELSEGLRDGRARVAAVLTSLLAQEFRGAALLPADEPAGNESPFQVHRAAALPADATLDARAFGGEVQRLTRDLRDVMLVGHSYAGMVITGVAERAADRLFALTFVDAFYPSHSESALDQMDPPFQQMWRQRAQDDGDGWLLPATDGLLDVWGIHDPPYDSGSVRG